MANTNLAAGQPTDTITTAENFAKFSESDSGLKKLNRNLTSQDNRKYFNKYQLITPGMINTGIITYVFFTKPDLNLLGSGGTIHDHIRYNSDFALNARTNPELFSDLQSSAISNPGAFIKLFGNSIVDYDAEDRIIKTRDILETTNDNKMVYGHRMNESIGGGTRTLTFRDDRDYAVFRLLEIWVSYIHNVTVGTIRPSSSNATNQIIDYFGSVYAISCREDGMEIINAEKLIGFPLNIPDSAVIKKNDSAARSVPDNYSIQWQYNHRRVGAEVILQFKNLCGSPTNGAYDSGYDVATGRRSSTLSKSVFIEEVKVNKSTGANMNSKFYLRWS